MDTDTATQMPSAPDDWPADGLVVLPVALAAATAQINAAVGDSEIGDAVVSLASRLLNAPDVRLALVDDDPDWLIIRAAVGPAAARAAERQPRGSDALGVVLRQAQPLRAAEFVEKPPDAAGSEALDATPGAPVVGVPLRVDGHLLGALSATRPNSMSPFTATDQFVLQLLGDLAAARLGASTLAAALRARARELGALDPTWRPPLDQAGDFVLVTKNRRHVIDADEAACRLMGYPRAELLQLELSDVHPMPSLAQSTDNLGAIRKQLLAGKSFTYDTVVRRRDGSLIPVRMQLQNFPVADGWVGRGICWDLRAEERAQAQALQTDKARLLAEVGSGLAHAINSPLAIVMGNTEMLLSETTNSDVRALVQPARDAAERISQAVQDLQHFARPVVPTAWSEIDVGQLARDTVELTRPLWEAGPNAEGRTIRVCLDAEPVSLVRAHVLELQEALRELLANAVQALPRGGTIVVRTEESDGHAVITVADDGDGMSDHVRQFCMEPFFTTRRPQANGLGLNRVYHTALRHRGNVQVESTEGQGTQVTLRLPLLSMS
jgi:PAS domain S-box-containing protein